MKKQIFVDGEYQYDYTLNGKIHTLSYSNTEFWAEHVRGIVAFEIKDTGDNLNIITAFNKKQMDYIDAERMLILLRIIDPVVYESSTKEIL